MKWRRIFTDPSFWILLTVNIFIVYSYEQNPKIFTTLLWLYWSQNVLYGIFVFFDMLTSDDANIAVSVKRPDKIPKIINFNTAWGFAFMFGFFHLAFLVFVATTDKTGPFDWHFYKTYLLVFFIFQLVSFIQHKLQKGINAAALSVAPMLRIIPLHLCILIPAFLHISNLTVFIVLKVIVDIITYVATSGYYQKNKLLADINVVNLDRTISPE